MGNNSSRNEEEGAPQEAQPVLHPQSEQILDPNQPSPTSNISHTNKNNRTNSSNIAHNNNNYDNKNKTAEAKKQALKLPHNCHAIIRDSDSPIDKSSPEILLVQLRAGVSLNGQKLRYWVTEKNINCFMVFAKGLKITWAEDMRYWDFKNIETSEGHITVAVLKNVCWLEAQGRLHTKHLTPGVKYEVAYVIMLEGSSYGFGPTVPVKFTLTLPNGTKQERKETLHRIPRDEWIRLSVGEFEAGTENTGEIEFSMYEYEAGNWKKGLVIKGVTIEPT